MVHGHDFGEYGETSEDIAGENDQYTLPMTTKLLSSGRVLNVDENDNIVSRKRNR